MDCEQRELPHGAARLQEAGMTVEVGGMIGAGVATLVAGLILVRARFRAASGLGKVLVLAPVFEAVPLAIFAAEHFLAARDLMGIVPKWLPWPLFWTYFVGAALLAAAISFIAWRHVRWSAALLALLFLIIVATVDLPDLPVEAHNRIFWTLTVRELCFAAGAMVLSGSAWPREGQIKGQIQSLTSGTLILVGRGIVAVTMVFYAIEHFFFPRNVPGVPLEKMTPEWIPAPVAIAYFVGITLLLGGIGAGIGLFVRRSARIAAVGAGVVLVLLTAFFYVPICIAELHSDLAVEGINYVGDTLLFAATVLLAGFGTDPESGR
jgi:uncharacterized membrane protein